MKKPKAESAKIHNIQTKVQGETKEYFLSQEEKLALEYLIMQKNELTKKWDEVTDNLVKRIGVKKEDVVPNSIQLPKGTVQVLVHKEVSE